MKNNLIILLIGIAFVGCNECGDVDEWINDAPTALEEYLEVREEIYANQDFVDEFSTKNGSFYLSLRDTNEYNKHPLPKLKNWLISWEGSILIRTNGSEEIRYRRCRNYIDGDIWGDLYHGDRVGNYKSVVTIHDSLELKDDWIAYVGSCKDCD